MFGFSTDFYWKDSNGARTPYSLAIELAFANGWYGMAPQIVRFNSLDPSEIDKGWVRDAFGNWARVAGSSGVIVPVVADRTFLSQDSDFALPLGNVRTVLEGISQGSARPAVWVQVGNEPYLGATGNHAPLTQDYADRAILLARAIKSAYPSVKTIAPPLGTFRGDSKDSCMDLLRKNWATYAHYFKGHQGAFDLLAGNTYRWDVAPTSPVDTSNDGIRFGRQMLVAAAAILGLKPAITELGLIGGSQDALSQALRVAGKSTPNILWKVGPGDGYDMIASGAIEVPQS